MTEFESLISTENEVFKTYAFWTAVLVLKMLLMSLLTGMNRHKNKVSNFFLIIK